MSQSVPETLEKRVQTQTQQTKQVRFQDSLSQNIISNLKPPRGKTRSSPTKDKEIQKAKIQNLKRTRTLRLKHKGYEAKTGTRRTGNMHIKLTHTRKGRLTRTR